MISHTTNPIEWASLLTDLDDAREHLENLVDEMARDGAIEESDFQVQLGHIYAHLNRTWNARNLEGEISEGEWEKFSQFPTDLEPVG